MMQSGAESSGKQQNGGSNHVFEANRSLISELNQENLRSAEAKVEDVLDQIRSLSIRQTSSRKTTISSPFPVVSSANINRETLHYQAIESAKNRGTVKSRPVPDFVTSSSIGKPPAHPKSQRSKGTPNLSSNTMSPKNINSLRQVFLTPESAHTIPFGRPEAPSSSPQIDSHSSSLFYEGITPEANILRDFYGEIDHMVSFAQNGNIDHDKMLESSSMPQNELNHFETLLEQSVSKLRKSADHIMESLTNTSQEVNALKDENKRLMEMIDAVKQTSGHEKSIMLERSVQKLHQSAEVMMERLMHSHEEAESLRRENEQLKAMFGQANLPPRYCPVDSSPGHSFVSELSQAIELDQEEYVYLSQIMDRHHFATHRNN